MKNAPTLDELAKIPPLGSTRGTKVEYKQIYDIYKFESKRWYVAEYGAEQGLFYGYIYDLHDMAAGRWDYFRLDDLLVLKNRKGREVRRQLRHRIRFWPVSVCRIGGIEYSYELRGHSMNCFDERDLARQE